jgi:Leishmanolysin
MRGRVPLSLLLGAAALAGCGPDEVSSPTTRSPEAVATQGGLPRITTARVGASGSFALPEAAQKFHITLRFINTPTADQQADFRTAADRWEGLVHGDVLDSEGTIPKNACGSGFKIPAFTGVIDDIMINVLLQPIDGPGNVLGAAGACLVRTEDGLPVYGLMFFDVDDLAFLEANNLLDEVIVHEMGHVLGFSAGIFNLNIPGLFQRTLLINPNTVDPRFIGQSATAKYKMLGGRDNTVPIEGLFCGPGTRNSHWDEVTFFNELMTGFINGASANFINPMSPMTSAAMKDLGYQSVPQGEDYVLRTSPNPDPCAPPPPTANAAVDGIDIAAREIVIDPVARIE